jgi:hypothetical protein
MRRQGSRRALAVTTTTDDARGKWVDFTMESGPSKRICMADVERTVCTRFGPYKDAPAWCLLTFTIDHVRHDVSVVPVLAEHVCEFLGKEAVDGDCG